ncbi:MAG: hypothetical protein VKO01_10550 [Cyanobacteriota bacterium]|jgi:hypothetical protein|nr:hypothetical protein [Cyanobacteriota bacterium]
MAQSRSVNPLGLLLVGVLCIYLGGCGLIYPHTPRSAVASAITSKLNQTQALLSDQLGLSGQPETAVKVSQVRITEEHWARVDQQPVVRVKGTYRLSGRGWQRQHKSHPFEIYLQRGDPQGQWLLIEQNTNPAPPGHPDIF